MPGEPARENGDLLLRSGLAFNGRITASVTHELNNVIGTIMQVVGLIEDLAMTEEVKQANLSDKMLSVVDRIERQADRGTTLIKQLNAFAHLGDEDRAECHLGEMLTNLANLSERLIGLKKVSLKRSRLDRNIVVITSPIQLAQAVFGSLQAALQVTTQGQEIELGMSESNQGAAIDIFTPFQGEPDQLELAPDVELIAAKLGLGIDVAAEGQGIHIRIRVPSTLEDGDASD